MLIAFNGAKAALSLKPALAVKVAFAVAFKLGLGLGLASNT